MSADLDTRTLIIGAGFAGRSVASRLDPSATVIVDRGEAFDPADATTNMARPLPTSSSLDSLPRPARHLFSPLVASEARAYASSALENRPILPLSAMSVNVYGYQGGGISNWWGGYSPRVSAETFAMKGVLNWPIGATELAPFYGEAERTLRVHGDPERGGQLPYGPMPGWQLWREYLADIFPSAHVTTEAKNLSDEEHPSMGLCQGRGHCTVCQNDAKARPANAFPEVSVHHNTIVDELVFEGRRVVTANCRVGGEKFDVRADRYVLAAGGLENIALLRRSQMPREVPAHLIGARYQDHTAAEIIVRMRHPMPWLAIGAEAHVEIPELSGYFHGIEVKTLLLTIPPHVDTHVPALANKSAPYGYDLLMADQSVARLARLYLQIEMPPEWNMQLRTRGQRAFIYSMPYLANVPLMNRVTLTIVERIAAFGLEVLMVEPHYQYYFGGHHYSGTTPMSTGENGVVDTAHAVFGTDNLFINGASIIPRCGAAGPTLSIVAMGLRLGSALK